jgi:hypothetical protein
MATNQPESDWFRQPTPREHGIAAMLFGGFGLFFVVFSFVLAGSWFRWLFLFLGVFSIVRALYHFMISRRRAVRDESTTDGAPMHTDLRKMED